MQATRQTRTRVAKRHARTAAIGKPSISQIVLGAILLFVLLTVMNIIMLGAEPTTTPATTGAAPTESSDSITDLAHSLRAESRLQRIEAAIN